MDTIGVYYSKKAHTTIPFEFALASTKSEARILMGITEYLITYMIDSLGSDTTMDSLEKLFEDQPRLARIFTRK
jgi:hypothetical protein